MLPNAVQRSHGLSRLTHAQGNAQDDARMVDVARRLNSPAPAILVDLLFAASGQTFESRSPMLAVSKWMGTPSLGWILMVCSRPKPITATRT
jgi:hypothetical protein